VQKYLLFVETLRVGGYVFLHFDLENALLYGFLTYVEVQNSACLRAAQ
jgi:hypothetical protein